MYRILIAICIVLATIQTSFAQEQVKKGTFSFNSGFSLPSSPEEFSDYWNSGINFGVGIERPISPKLIFQACLDYNTFPMNEDKFLSEAGVSGYDISLDGGGASIINVSANLKAPLSVKESSVTPYFVGGLGIFRLSVGDITVRYQGQSETAEGASETALSILLGTGLDFTINPKVKMFVEIKYGIGFTEGESTKYIPIKVGLSFK